MLDRKTVVFLEELRALSTEDKETRLYMWARSGNINVGQFRTILRTLKVE